MFSREESLATYGGVAHAHEDISRRWSESIVECYTPGEKIPKARLLSNFNGDSLRLVDENDKVEQTDIYHVYISREFPQTGIMPFRESVYFVSRQNDRQWQRGTNQNTIDFTELFNAVGKKGFASFNQLAFKAFDSKRFDSLGFNAFDNQIPLIVSRRLWLKPPRNGFRDVFYIDTYVGMVDKDKNFIPHSDSETLVEEAVNELGFKVI